MKSFVFLLQGIGADIAGVRQGGGIRPAGQMRKRSGFRWRAVFYETASSFFTVRMKRTPRGRWKQLQGVLL